MRTFDYYGLKMCQYQGELFALSGEKVECSSPVFLRRFMYSDVAVRMDGEGFLLESTQPCDVIEEINDQYGDSSYGQTVYGKEELYWIGYIYRYWCYTHGISSLKAYRMVKPDELKMMYYPYHSLDPAQVIERIIEAKELGEEDLIKKGVQILRRIKQGIDT